MFLIYLTVGVTALTLLEFGDNTPPQGFGVEGRALLGYLGGWWSDEGEPEKSDLEKGQPEKSQSEKSELEKSELEKSDPIAAAKEASDDHPLELTEREQIVICLYRIFRWILSIV